MISRRATDLASGGDKKTSPSLSSPLGTEVPIVLCEVLSFAGLSEKY